MGIVAPWILLGIIYCLDYLLRIILNMPILISSSTMQLIAIVMNVLALRYYLSSLKYEKTGKGILVITFLYIIAFFANEYLFKY